ncbi:MAG: ASCH domain-containing protein [Candidatus Nanoarchaeia archaeon]
MKALSLKQPWAELILQGKKTIELRKWKTKFRGKFYIHASGSIDDKSMERYNFKDLPKKSLVGTAELVEVITYTNKKEFLKDKNKHLALTDEWGKYGFVLINIKRIKPIPYKGQLNFFEVKE